MSQVFHFHGLLQNIISGRGPQFISRFWKEFCRVIGASAWLSSGFHPQSHGQTKCYNQELQTSFRCFVGQTPSQWSQKLVWIEDAHNSLSLCPQLTYLLFTVYGYLPPLFSDLEGEVCSSSFCTCPSTPLPLNLEESPGNLD